MSNSLANPDDDKSTSPLVISLTVVAACFVIIGAIYFVRMSQPQCRLPFGVAGSQHRLEEMEEGGDDNDITEIQSYYDMEEGDDDNATEIQTYYEMEEGDDVTEIQTYYEIEEGDDDSFDDVQIQPPSPSNSTVSEPRRRRRRRQSRRRKEYSTRRWRKSRGDDRRRRRENSKRRRSKSKSRGKVRVGMIEIRMVIDEEETMIVTIVNGARAEKRARAGMIDMKIGHEGGARAGTGVRAGIIDFRMIIDEENRAIVMSLEGGSVITIVLPIEGQKAIMNTTGETSLGGQGGQKASLEEEGQVREIVL